MDLLTVYYPLSSRLLQDCVITKGSHVSNPVVVRNDTLGEVPLSRDCFPYTNEGNRAIFC